jgi:hypothetical protein
MRSGDPVTIAAMTARGFRQLALRLPETVESAHMDHPDFRVAGKIFATLGYPDAAWGMVKLSPIDQELFIHADPVTFVAVKGAWGRGGATNVCLRSARKPLLQKALASAWRNTAPPRLTAQTRTRPGR